MILFSYVSIGMILDILMICSLISLLITRNNIVLLLNFISILFLLSFTLFLAGVIEYTIVIILTYQSAIIVLFLVNGLFIQNQA